MEHLSMKQKVTIMVSVMAVLLFAALNMTIVGTALPKIVSSIGGMEYFNWVFTIYMLTSSITAILVGKLSDMYGRKPFILIGVGIFMIGSLLSGFSESIYQLILFRGIQGFGGGMVMSTAFTTVGDLFAPRERGRWQGLMGATFGVASLFGPTLGGYIVDHMDWSWVFWIFLPIGLVAMALIAKLYPVAGSKDRSPVDYLGSVVLSAALVAMLLGFTWADTEYEWLSAPIIGLFAASILAFVWFIRIEQKAVSPVVPLHLFKNSVFTLSNIAGLLTGIGMFGLIMYIPFFVQGVLGASATTSGLVEMAMTLTMVATSVFAGQLITKTGKYKALALIGLVIMSVGIALNAFLGPDSPIYQVVINLMIAGIGLGCTFPVFTLTVQNAVEHKLLGVATATSQLSREIGGTVGVAVLGSVMGSIMASKLSGSSALPPMPTPDASAGATTGAAASVGAGAGTGANPLEALRDPQVLMSGEQLEGIRAGLPEAMHPLFDQMLVVLKDALSSALSSVFLLCAIITALSVITTWFLKEIPLRTSNEESAEALETPESSAPGPRPIIEKEEPSYV